MVRAVKNITMVTEVSFNCYRELIENTLLLLGEVSQKYSVESVFSLFLSPGLRGVDTAVLGIPSEEELVSTYTGLTGVTGVEENWNFYLAFTFFRVAAILQGVYKRSLQRK